MRWCWLEVSRSRTWFATRLVVALIWDVGEAKVRQKVWLVINCGFASPQDACVTSGPDIE